MPRVPVAEQTVAPQLIQTPTARRQDFSGFQRLAGGIDQLAQVKEKELQDEQRARVSEAENDLHKDLLDIDTRFRSLQGKQAYDGKQAYLDEIDGAVESHRSKLNSKFQDRIYSEVAKTRKKNAMIVGETHAREQLKKYNIEQQGARVTLAKEDSIQNPFLAVQNQNDIDGTIDDLLVGSSSEVIEAEKLKQSSAHFMGVADHYLALDKPEVAKEFLDKMKKHYGDRQILTGEDQSKFDLAYEKVLGKVEVSRAITEVYNTYGDDVGAMEADLWDRFADKPENYEKAMQLLNTRMNTKSKQEKRANDEMANNLADAIYKGDFTTENFTDEQLDVLDKETQEWLRKYEYMLSIEASEDDSVDAYIDWLTMPIEDKRNPDVLRESLKQMNEEQQTATMSIFRSLTLGSDKTAEAGVQETRGLALKQMFEAMGIDKNTNKNKPLKIQVSDLYHGALDRYTKTHGREPDRNTVKQIEADIMRQVSIYDGYTPRQDQWLANKFRDATTTAGLFEIPTDEQGNSLMTDQDRERAINAIKQLERARGEFIPLTPATIWNAHLQLRNQSIQEQEINKLNTPVSGVDNGKESQGYFDGDPLDAFREGATGDVMKQLNVNNYSELKAMAESEIPTKQAQMATEMLAEVDRKVAIANTDDKYQKYLLMNEEERPDYLKTLSYDDRFMIIRRWRNEQDIQAFEKAREQSIVGGR